MKNGKKPGFVLDSFALLSYFQAEPGGEQVRQILKKALLGDALVFVSVISLGEVYYIIARKRGKNTAREIIQDIESLPVNVLDADFERVIRAAEVKADHPMSYADAFVAAAAMEFSATIVSGDPEFKTVEANTSVLWI